MTKQEWGNATWYLFHTLAEKIKPEFSNETPVLLDQIVQICKNLPCPDCQNHATKTLMSVNIKAITSRESLITFIWQFHNKVNARLKKRQISEEDRDKLYKKAITYNIIVNFFNVMSKRMGSERAMLYSYHRSKCIKIFTEYINKNYYKFNK